MSLLPSKPDTSSADDAEPRVIGVDSDDADDVIAALSSETARELLAELHEEPAPPSKLSDRVDTSLQNAQYHLGKLQSAGAVSVVDTVYSEKGREMDVYAPADQPLVIFAGGEEKTTGLKAALARLLSGVGILGIGSLAIQALYGRNNVYLSGASGGAGDAGGPAAPATATTTTTPQPTPTPKPEPTTADGDPIGISKVTTAEPTNETAQTVTETTTTTTEEALQTVSRESIETVTETTMTAADTVTQTTGPELSAGVPPGLLFFAGGLLVLSVWLAVWYTR